MLNQRRVFFWRDGMKESQKIALELSEIRQKLNTLGDDASEERDALVSTYNGKESEYPGGRGQGR